MVTAKQKEIQRMTNLINANISITGNHPELKERLGDENGKLRAQIEELKREPIKNKGVVVDADQENVVRGRCKAIVGATKKLCCNAEASDGYCLIHLKQRSPEKAEKYQRERLKKEFELTDEEIDEIAGSNNGKLWNVSKGFIKYFKRMARKEKL